MKTIDEQIEEMRGARSVMELFEDDWEVSTCFIGKASTVHLRWALASRLRTMCGRTVKVRDVPLNHARPHATCAACADVYFESRAPRFRVPEKK